jgi:hypothetical protein
MTDSSTPNKPKFPSADELFANRGFSGRGASEQRDKQRSAYEAVVLAHADLDKANAELREQLAQANQQLEAAKERNRVQAEVTDTGLRRVRADVVKGGRILAQLAYLMSNAEFTTQSELTPSFRGRPGGITFTYVNSFGTFQLRSGSDLDARTLRVTPADRSRRPVEIRLVDGDIPADGFLVLQALLNLDTTGQLPKRAADVYRAKSASLSAMDGLLVMVSHCGNSDCSFCNWVTRRAADGSPDLSVANLGKIRDMLRQPRDGQH